MSEQPCLEPGWHDACCACAVPRGKWDPFPTAGMVVVESPLLMDVPVVVVWTRAARPTATDEP